MEVWVAHLVCGARQNLVEVPVCFHCQQCWCAGQKALSNLVLNLVCFCWDSEAFPSALFSVHLWMHLCFRKQNNHLSCTQINCATWLHEFLRHCVHGWMAQKSLCLTLRFLCFPACAVVESLAQSTFTVCALLWKQTVKIQSQISFNASQKTFICPFESSCLIWTDNQPNRASAALDKSCHSCTLVHWGNSILCSGHNPLFSHVFLRGMSQLKASLGPIVAVIIAMWIVS